MLTSQKVIDAINDQIGYEFTAELQYYAIAAYFASEALPQTGRIMVKDEDVCVHCGLCAERCPTAAWDMKKFDLLLPYAGRPACNNS